MNVFSEREVRKLCKDLEWEEVVLVLLSVLDGVNGEIYDDFKMSIEVYKNDKKKKEVKETQLWIYEIFNNNKIIEKIEQWTKEAEEAGMTLAEYLETINPLNKAGKRGKRMKDFELPREPRFYEFSEMEKIANSCVALEFSADIDEPGKWQDKNGEWHTGEIIEGAEE